MATIKFTNKNNNAIEISLIGRSGSTVMLPGKVDDVDGTLELSIDPVIWYSAEQVQAYYVDTFGSIPGISYEIQDDSEEQPSFNATIAVTDVSGSAIEGASVQYDTETKSTSVDGTVVFEGITAKTVSIVVTKEGYNTTTLSDVVISGSANESFHIVLVAE